MAVESRAEIILPEAKICGQKQALTIVINEEKVKAQSLEDFSDSNILEDVRKNAIRIIEDKTNEIKALIESC